MGTTWGVFENIFRWEMQGLYLKQMKTTRGVFEIERNFKGWISNKSK
jgi:hypothetical protein